MNVAPTTSTAWKSLDEAVQRFLAQEPGSADLERALAVMNTLELELERADLLASGELEDAEVIAILEGVAAVLRGRVRDELLVGALEAVESVLTAPKPWTLR